MSEEQTLPGKSPGFWFYPHDYERDVQILSLGAQGLWMRMLCWMHDNEMYRGFLELPSGQPMTPLDISRKVGKPLTIVKKLLHELRVYGVMSETEVGGMYCRRMARDSKISDVRRKAAQARLSAANRSADGKFAGDFAGAKQPAKDEQKPSVTVSVSDSVTDTDSSIGSVCERSSYGGNGTATISRAQKSPAAINIAKQASGRFEEFWQAWSTTRGTERRDAAAQAWMSVVSVENDAVAIECARSYLASSRVADGGGYHPDNFLFAMARDGFATRWPPFRPTEPKRALSVTERAKQKWLDRQNGATG